MSNYVTRTIGRSTVQAESVAALEALMQHFGYWMPESVAKKGETK